jgi:hypothetical protein
VHPRLGGNQYWIGASDHECEGIFGWCELDQPFPPWIPWHRTEPTNGNVNATEQCVVLNYSMSLIDRECQFYFEDGVCEDQNYFICEVKMLDFLA